MPEDAAFVELLVAFGHALRDEGMAVGSGDVLTYCAAVAALDPTDLLDLYWAGHATLVTRRDQTPVYDRVFRRFFLDADERPPEREPFEPVLHPARQGEAVVQVPASELRLRRPRARGDHARPGGLRHRGVAGQVVRGVHA